MEICGIKFAPLNVPLQRRLQTLAVAGYMITGLVGVFGSPFLTLYLLFYSQYWWLVALYLCWIWTIDRSIGEKGGRQIKWVRSLAWWKYIRDYFPVSLKKLPEVELDPKRNYLFCCFPHGALIMGVFNAFGSEWSEYKELFPHHTPHTTTWQPHYYILFIRELVLALGGVSASAASIDYILGMPEGGHVCVLILGGMPETYITKAWSYNVFLKKRKRFIRLAMKNATPLVPVISFGETDVYNLLSGWGPLTGMGRGFFQYTFGMLPHRRRITTVVGVPLEVPKTDNPSKELVDQYHEEFTKKLIELFEEHKFKYLEKPEGRHLVIM